MSLSELSKKLLSRGVAEWIGMDVVASTGLEMLPGASQEDVREECVRSIGELRDGGYVRVGDVTRAGFTSWVGETGDILRRIDTEWRSRGTPRLGDIGWLENTPVGNRFGLAEWEKWKKQEKEAADKTSAINVERATSLGELSRQILWRGIDDFVNMCEVASVARRMRPDASTDEMREQCLRAIGELREGGYARVGDLARTGFTSWTGETGDVLRRIDDEWRALGVPRLGDIGWLENTPIGNCIGIVEWQRWKKEKLGDK